MDQNDWLTAKLLAFTLLGASWVLKLLAVLSVVSLFVIFERAFYFARRSMSQVFPQLLEKCLKGDLAGAAQLSSKDSMEAEVVRVAATTAGGGQAALEKAIASTIDRRRLEYEQWLFILGTLGNNAPFIGLFGTVLGIIRAFADLAKAHGQAAGGTAAAMAAGPGTVMAGISEALVATAVGLAVAIPAVLAFNLFQRLLKRVVGRSLALSNAISSGQHATARGVAMVAAAGGV